MINGVSFGTNQVSYRGTGLTDKEKFEQLALSEPAFTEKPLPAAGLNDGEKKKGMSKLTKVALYAGAAAVVLGLLRGKVDAFKNIELVEGGLKAQQGIMNKAKYVIAQGGEYVLKGLAAVKNLLPFGRKAAEKVAEGTAEKVAETASKVVA